MIGVLHYGMGNLKSVANAVDYQGYDVLPLTEPSQLQDCTHLIIPGVGSFNKAAANLQQLGFVEPIRQFAAAGKPVLGICLGMQLLASRGIEHGEADGLNLIPGDVIELDSNQCPHIPHVGWNACEWQQSHPVIESIKPGIDFYFVHSYHYQVKEPEHQLGTTEYNQVFTAAVAQGNVVGTQFHPEKSQDAGMQLLENFCDWDGSC